MISENLTLQLSVQGQQQVNAAMRSVGQANAQAASQASKSAETASQAWARASGAISGDVMALAGSFGEVAAASMPAVNGITSFARGVAGATTAAIAMGAAAAGLTAKILDVAAAGEKGNQIAANFEGGEEAMTRLRDATAGLAADQDLQTAANSARAFGLEIGNTADLMKIATVQSIKLGREGSESVMRIINGAVRGSNNLLEELGVKIPPTKKIYEDFAEAAGKSVDQLTEAEKRNAVAAKIIADNQAALNQEVDKGGSAVARSGVQWDNFVSTMEGFLAETLSASGAMDVLSMVMEQVSVIFSENKDVIGDLIESGMSVLVQVMENALVVIGPIMPLAAQIAQLFAALAPITAAWSAALGGVLQIAINLINIALVPLAVALEGVLGAAADAADALGATGMATSLRKASEGFAKYLESTDKSIESSKVSAETNKQVAKAIEAAGDAADGSAPKIGNLKDAMDKLSDEQKAALTSLAEGTDIGRAEQQVDKLGLSFNRSKHNLGRFEEEFGDLLDLARSSDQDFEAAYTAQEILARAMERSGGDTKVAQAALKQYVATLRESFEVAGTGVGGLLQNRGEAEEVLKFLQAIENAAFNIINPPKPPDGKDNRDARRELIYQAKLVGLTETQRAIEEINRELAENLKIAGRNAQAIEASHTIAAAKIREVGLDVYAEAGEAVGGIFVRAFDGVLERWTPKESMFREAFALANARANLAAHLFAEAFINVDSIEAQRIHVANMAASMAPLNEAMAATRTEVDALMGSFSGENVDPGMAWIINMTSAVEEMSMSVTDNFGGIANAFISMREAMDMEDAGDAARAGFDAFGAAAQGSIAIGKTAANALIKDKKKLAATMGAFEVAEAFASAARLDFLGAAAHTLASIKYFAIAGGGAGAPTASKSTKDRQAEQRTQLTSRDSLLDRRATGPQQINQYFFSSLDGRPSGEIVADALNASARRRSNVKVSGAVISPNNVLSGV